MSDHTGTTIFTHFDVTKRFPAGEKIFSAGDPGDFMYAVIEGEVNILLGGEVVETVGPGGLVGEMALLDKGTRSADVVAKSDTVLACVDEQEFTRQVHRNPFFALEVMRIIVRRLRQADERV